MKPVPNKPGKQWTPQERDQVRQWVCQPEQLQKLYAIARSWFPHEPPESIWNEFFGSDKSGADGSALESRFDRTVDNLDSTKGDFWSYLQMRFHYFCQERAGDVGKAQSRNVSLDQPESASSDTEAPPLDLLSDPTQTQPDEAAADRDAQSFGRKVVEPVLASLTPDERRVLGLYYFEQQSVEAIAQATGHTVPWVKVTLHRARQKVLVALIKQASTRLRPEELAVLRLHYIEGFRIDGELEQFTTGQIAGALQVRAGETPAAEASAAVNQLLARHAGDLHQIQSALVLGPAGPQPATERFLEWLGAVTALLDQAKQHLERIAFGEE